MKWCCPALRGRLSAIPPSATAAAALASSLRCRLPVTTWDVVIYILLILRARSSQSPFQTLLLPKWKQKMMAKPGRPQGLCRSEQPFLTQREKESQRGRETEITHSTIYCPKTTSSTKGATVIIGEKKHSPLMCEGDLQRGSLPTARALGSQGRRARQLRAAACGTTNRLEGPLTERGVLSPPLAWHHAATAFQNASC